MPLEPMSDFFDTRADSYDHHMLEEMGLDVFYEEIARQIHPARADFTLLDLGCGTGLELERLYVRFPAMRVTGIDLSAGMLEQLRAKLPGKDMRLLCGSYFDVDFGGDYDAVLSTYSLHHFEEDAKRALYQKIRAALNPGGQFLWGDYIAATPEKQQALAAENRRLRWELGVPDGAFYHFDIPLTPENERRLLLDAGFTGIELVRRWDNTVILRATP